MRHFIFNVWIWDKSHHSRLLGTCRLECSKFPCDRDCREALAKDANYSKHIASSECEVAIGNIREYIP